MTQCQLSHLSINLFMHTVYNNLLFDGRRQIPVRILETKSQCISYIYGDSVSVMIYRTNLEFSGNVEKDITFWQQAVRLLGRGKSNRWAAQVKDNEKGLEEDITKDLH